MQYPYHLTVNVEIIIIKKKKLLFFGLKGQKSIAFAKKKEKKNVAKITALTQSNGSSFCYNSAVQ